MGQVFIKANLIFPKLDEIITHNKVTTNQSIGEREEHALHLIEYIVSSAKNILIFFEKEIDNDYCSVIGESQNPFLSAMPQASIIQDRMTQQLNNQQLMIGLYHSKLNPLISTWNFSKSITRINLIHMWLMGNRK